MDSISFQLEITENSLLELKETINYIGNTLHNHTAANKLYNEFFRKLKYIIEFPFSMPFVKNNYGFDYHKFFIGNFICIYFIDINKNIIYVIDFRYAPSSLEDYI